MKLSVIIPARNEAGSVEKTVTGLIETLRSASIGAFELVLVDDGSTDETAQRVTRISCACPEVRLVPNSGSHGFGMAVRCGLEAARGEAVAIVMADGSDHPEDLVACFRELERGYDCVFGSRFIRRGQVNDYPIHKLILNRMANWFIRMIFRVRFNDFTNAFKLYRRETIDGIQPLISRHFNLTVEMPLKAIIRGYSFSVIPIRWTNRRMGVSKLKLQEMGSRYLFIVLYLWLEKHLSRGDYHRHNRSAAVGMPKAAV